VISNHEEIASSAFDVLEEVCFEEKSLNQLISVNEKIIELQSMILIINNIILIGGD
jgi:hypothetical protein